MRKILLLAFVALSIACGEVNQTAPTPVEIYVKIQPVE